MGNPSLRLVPFNALPPAVRQRLVAATQHRASPAPLLADIPADIGPVVGIVIVALCAAGWLYSLVDSDFGVVSQPDSYQSAAAIASYAASLFLLGWCALSLVRRAFWRHKLPYRAGTYLFPVDLVDATGPVLKVLPVALLRELQPTRHYVNGGYTQTTFALTFEGGARYNFSIANLHAADEALARFRAAQGHFRQAAQVGDLDTIRGLDVFFDCRVDGSWERFGPAPPAAPVPTPPDAPAAVVREAPRPLQRAWLTALVAALGLAGPVWFVRNRLSDLLRYDEVSSPTATRAACRAYLDQGGPHADEVRARHLPVAALRESVRQQNVTALRAYLREFPQSPVLADARRAIHGHFERVQRTYTEQAATDDPRMLPFMLHMLRFMEERDSPPVQVRFAPPSTELLTRADAALQEEGMRLVHRPVAPIAGQFDEASSVPREQAITRSLQRAFAVVFPGDILRLVDGGRRTGPSTQDPNAATFDVSYTVAPSGSFYTSDTQARAFVGIIIAFEVTMRVPGAEPYGFAVTVQPPRHFTVDRSRDNGGEAPDTLVYDVMAERAFDRLADRFRAVFFRPGSPGFNGGARDEANEPATEPAEAAPTGGAAPQGASGDGEPAGDAPRGRRHRRR